MTAKDAVAVAQGYTRMTLGVCLVFIVISLLFSGVTVLSPDVHETLEYDNQRKVMCIGYTLLSVTMLLAVLHLTGRSNAALRLGHELLPVDPDAEATKPTGIFRPLSALWALFFMTTIIITVNYIVLIYARDGGLF